MDERIPTPTPGDILKEDFWLNLQMAYDVLETKSKTKDILDRIKLHSAS